MVGYLPDGTAHAVCRGRAPSLRQHARPGGV